MAAAAIAQPKEQPKSNELCYVCHYDLITEDITNIHLKKDVVCTDCHGPSTHHMHDEMLMTKPDKLYGRTEVEGLCKHCHTDHVHKDQEKMDAFIAEWLGKDRPNGRVITPDSICTDCHGTHNIVKEMKGAAAKDEGEWTALFNGENLDNFKPTDGATWQIKRGRIVAAPAPETKTETLWTEDAYTDFLVAVTFRTTGPVRAGIRLRGEAKDAPAVWIADAKDDVLPGSVFIPDKGTVLANLDKELVSEMMWNTLSIKLQGPRLTTWLNGEEIGSIRLPATTHGPIGLFIEPADKNQKAELTISEIQLQPLKE
jgi:hypothetical protein